jgi:hypothetical protein
VEIRGILRPAASSEAPVGECWALVRRRDREGASHGAAAGGGAACVTGVGVAWEDASPGKPPPRRW